VVERHGARPRREGSAASLTAEAGLAVFRVAFERWVDDRDRMSLACLMGESFDGLRAVTAGA
jgi:hypothetical protein